jgi:hypothetical protein
MANKNSDAGQPYNRIFQMREMVKLSPIFCGIREFRLVAPTRE